MILLPFILSFFFLSSTIAVLQSPITSSATSPNPSSTAESTTLSQEERDELLDLHEKLVEIPSTSGQEIEVAQFVLDYLTNLGYYVEKVNVSSSRYDVFAYPTVLKDQGSWPEVLITSHLDTVPPHIPFEKRQKNGTVYHYGRGTVDAKGPVAGQIIAAHKFFQSRSDTPSLGLLFVVGEEVGGDGMKAFASYASNTTFRAAIFGEPTESKLATGHKGSLGVTLDVVGKAAHSAYEWLGVSAIDYLTKAITALNFLEPLLPSSDLLGPSTLNTGRIAGGLVGNIVAANANASVSIRVARSEPSAPDDIRVLVQKVLAPVINQTAEAGGTFNVIFANFTYPAQVLETDVPGLDSKPMYYGTDIPSLPQVDKKYLYGPGSIQVAHSPQEEVSQDELVAAAEAYGKILEHLFSDEI